MLSRYQPFLRILIELAPGLHVAGGAVRDCLLGLPVSDVDVVFPPGARYIAARFAERTCGTRIALREDEPDKMTERVVAREGDETLLFDFTARRGASIEDDLAGRDFTVTAMAMPLDAFVHSMSGADIPTVPGTAVFLTPHPDQVPHSLLHSLKHYKSLHERVVILNVNFTDEPFVPDEQRVRVAHLGERYHRVEVFFGFMDRPDLTGALHRCTDKGMPCDPENTTFFLGRETMIPKRDSEMAWWREKLFIAMSRNAGTVADYFGLPHNRVVELGAQIVL